MGIFVMNSLYQVLWYFFKYMILFQNNVSYKTYFVSREHSYLQWANKLLLLYDLLLL